MRRALYLERFYLKQIISIVIDVYLEAESSFTIRKVFFLSIIIIFRIIFTWKDTKDFIFLHLWIKNI